MFYIYRDTKDRPYNVWNHRLGAWACDFDAGYPDNQFGYKSKAYAYKRAIARADSLTQPVLSTRRSFSYTDRGNLDIIKVLTRAELFEHIGVKDWSGGR